MGTITVTVLCAICGDAFKQYQTTGAEDFESHGLCAKPACVDEYRSRLGLPPIDEDPNPELTRTFLAEINEELVRSFRCAVCAAPFDPEGCRCMWPLPAEPAASFLEVK